MTPPLGIQSEAGDEAIRKYGRLLKRLDRRIEKEGGE